jgi:hypothetical protein
MKGKPSVSVVTNSSLSVSEGHLGDLVDISLQHPELVVPSELARYRRRLKKGDRVYLVREGEQVVLFGWTTVSRRVHTLGSEANQRVPNNASLMLLEECSAVSKIPERVHYRELFCALSEEANKTRAALGICFPNWDPALRSELKVMDPLAGC